jgi:hypothetical protein
LQVALAEESAAREFVIEQRLEELRRRLEEDAAVAAHASQARRVATLRKLGKARAAMESHVDQLTGTGSFAGVGVASGSGTAGASKGRKATRDIIREYADYGSRVYAPMLRNGRVPETAASPPPVTAFALTADTALRTLDGVEAFASTIAARPALTEASLSPPRQAPATTAGERQAAAIGRNLDQVHTALQVRVNERFTNYGKRA